MKRCLENIKVGDIICYVYIPIDKPVVNIVKIIISRPDGGKIFIYEGFDKASESIDYLIVATGAGFIKNLKVVKK